MHSSCAIFEGYGMTPLFEAMLLEGKDVIRVPPSEPIHAKEFFQLSMCNLIIILKTTNMSCFWSLLVAKGILNKYLSFFFMMGHTHDDIDVSFGH